MTDAQVNEIEALKKEIIWLKLVVTELTQAVSLLTEKDERAQAFVKRIQELSD